MTENKANKVHRCHPFYVNSFCLIQPWIRYMQIYIKTKVMQYLKLCISLRFCVFFCTSTVDEVSFCAFFVVVVCSWHCTMSTCGVKHMFNSLQCYRVMYDFKWTFQIFHAIWRSTRAYHTALCATEFYKWSQQWNSTTNQKSRSKNTIECDLIVCLPELVVCEYVCMCVRARAKHISFTL